MQITLSKIKTLMESSREMVTIRQAAAGDENILLEFTKAEQWDYSVYDYEAAMNIDPEFLLVAVDNSNKPLGFGGIAQYSPDTWYIDAFIVRDDLRRKGIGRQIWKALLERAGQNNICLDGCLALTKWYKKHGFIYDSYTIHSYTAVVTSELKSSMQSPYAVTRFSESMWPALMKYDQNVYPNFNRENILRAWFIRATTVVALAGGNIVGYGSIHKKSENKYGIRNVFADNEVVAETIVRYLCETVPDNAIVHFAVIKENPLPILRTHLKARGTCKRMYTKAEININTAKIWIHSNTKI